MNIPILIGFLFILKLIFEVRMTYSWFDKNIKSLFGIGLVLVCKIEFV